MSLFAENACLKYPRPDTLTGADVNAILSDVRACPVAATVHASSIHPSIPGGRGNPGTANYSLGMLPGQPKCPRALDRAILVVQDSGRNTAVLLNSSAGAQRSQVRFRLRCVVGDNLRCHRQPPLRTIWWSLASVRG